MTEREAKTLTDKAMKVILSCNSMDQLNNAVQYANLTYRRLSNHVGMVNFTRFSMVIERSIGFAQCKIKANQGQDVSEA